MQYECGLTLEELKKRTSKDYLSTKKFLDVDSPEFIALAEGDKKALSYLVKAGRIIEKINMELDSHHNLAFKKYLEDEVSKGDERAILTKKLFDAQKGIFALDSEMNKIALAKGLEAKKGIGVYPDDLSTDEFHTILIKMLKEGKRDEVAKILNQRSVVERDGDELVGIDYVDKFHDDFKQIADLLLRASTLSTNKEFNEYLRLQSQAFLVADPMLDAYADKKWASMQDTPLEFTITREGYEDEMTETVLENPELAALLKENDIKVYGKDTLGARIGIVNKEGTDYILKVKDLLPLMAQNMPYNDQYEQTIGKSADSVSQTMVDADIIELTGDSGAYRAGITLAENLPNDDKLSLTIGGGRRNVYHRQVRFITSPDAREKLKKLLDATVDKSLHPYYEDEMDHAFTIGHENGHSLGPKGVVGLGKYSSIIEENKADMVSLSMLDVLTEAGLYTKEERDKIIVTYAVDNMMKTKPDMSKAHRVRSVMQNYYFIKKGAISISSDGVLSVNIDKMVETAREMLSEIVKIQMNGGDFEAGEKYVLENFQWTPEMEEMGKKMREINKTLNGTTEHKLADYLFEMNV